MSSVPSPVSEITAPFVPTTTPAIERANRLISLRAHPGFNDLLRLSQELVQSAADICADYPGWDDKQIVVLKVRMQAAKEHHQLLLAKINEAIEEGISEGREKSPSLPEKTAAEALEQGDFVRMRVLEKFSDMDNNPVTDNRPAGSY